MASYEKIIKYVVERFQQALSPLDKIVENQEKIIRQNAELQATLTKIYHRSVIKEEEEEKEEDLTLPEDEDLSV